MITVTNLSKSYKLQHERALRYKSLRDELVNSIRNPFSRSSQEVFWALDDISFSVKQGETIGIIGANGAGKSTLLKILSRITPPTKGEVVLRGRVSSLLEVGTGFHPELTGRENIYLNGAILGMTKKEITRKFDEIVAFAEVERFLDTPVKHFSSGMYMRLAFSVAAHLEPEILIVDEVLAVGDMNFQKKCLGRMSEVSKQGRTVLFVSHNMGAISDLCRRCILLEKGKIVAFDSTPKVVSRYFTDMSEKMGQVSLVNKNPSAAFTFSSISIFNKEKKATAIIDFQEPFTIMLKAAIKKPVEQLLLSLSISSSLGHPLYNSQVTAKELKLGSYVGEVQFSLELNPNMFGSGTYTISLGAQWGEMNYGIGNAISFTIADKTNFDLPRYIMYDGYVVYPRKWRIASSA